MKTLNFQLILLLFILPNLIFAQQKNLWTSFTTADGLPDNNILSILESSDGKLWFGTEKGISCYHDGIWTNLTTADGLAHDLVNAIIESSTGAIWFGTRGGGVSRLYQGAWKTFTASDGLAYNDVLCVYESSDGTLWFGTNGGLSRYQNEMWTTFTMTDGLPSNYIMTIVEASDGTMWLGTYGKGACNYQEGAWNNYSTSHGLINQYVLAMVQASDGSLWFGTQNGVSQYQNGIWKSYRTSDGLAGNYVPAIFESSDGILWFGTSNGVSSYQNGNWKSLSTNDGLVHNSIRSMTESSDGAIWFGTYEGGVSQFQAGVWTTYNTADGLLDNDVTAIFENANGTMWFGTFGGGVTVLKPDKSPPSTFIMSDPPSLSGNSIIEFNFNGRDFRTRPENLLFSYALLKQTTFVTPNPDQISWSPFTFNTEVQTKSLYNGDYTFFVRARDTWGNVDPTPASWNFKIDITSPTVTINFPKPEETIAGVISIIGSAYDTSPIKDFSKYALSYSFNAEWDDNTIWRTDRFQYQNNLTEIRDDTLAIWNTSGLQNGTYWLHLSAKDGLDHESHDFVRVQIVKASHVIDSRQGGNLNTASGNIQIYIPPNAIPKDNQMNIKDLSVTQLLPIDNLKITAIYFCFEVLPADLQLAKPGTMTLTYSDTLISDKNEVKLAIYHTHDGGQNWQRLGGTVNIVKNKITTTFKQFGVFALYEDLTEGGKSGILNVNSQPRIFSPQGNGYDDKTAISFDLGTESNVTIKIYNPAGRLIRVLIKNEQMSHGNNVVYWDGKDQQGEFCMSGLYIVTIQAEEKMATKTVVVLNK